MIGYVAISASNVERATKFYTNLFSEQGAQVLMDVGRIAFIGKNIAEPMLAVCEHFEGEDCSADDGSMVAFPTNSKEEAAALFNKAISLGATNEGGPGQRIPDRFYGSYVRDLDGNKLRFFVCG